MTEATLIITLGSKHMSGAPGVMILERPIRELKKLSARMSARFHESRIAQLTRQLVERPCPQHDVWLHMILEHSTQLSGAWLSTIPREYISLLPKTIDIGIRSRLLMTTYKCGSPMGLCGCGTQVVRDAPFRDIEGGGSGAEALRFAGAPEEEQAAAAAAATGFVAGGIAAAGLQPESAHYARCRLGSSARTRRSYACVRSIIRAFRADGAVLSDEDFTKVHTDSRRGSDWYVYSYGDGAAAGRPQGHFDFECTTLNYVLPAGRSWPQLSRGPARQSNPTRTTRGSRSGGSSGVPGLREDPHGGAAEAESSRAGKRNPLCCVCRWRHHGWHGRATALGQGRSGRHYERQHLSGTLLKYRHRLAAEFVSRCCARAGVAFDRHGTA